MVAKSRGGAAPPSNIVIARPSRSRELISLDLPGPLPPSVREILDVEDLFRKEEKAAGMAAVEQVDLLRRTVRLRAERAYGL